MGLGARDGPVEWDAGISLSRERQRIGSAKVEKEFNGSCGCFGIYGSQPFLCVDESGNLVAALTLCCRCADGLGILGDVEARLWRDLGRNEGMEGCG